VSISACLSRNATSSPCTAALACGRECANDCKTSNAFRQPVRVVEEGLYWRDFEASGRCTGAHLHRKQLADGRIVDGGSVGGIRSSRGLKLRERAGKILLGK